MDVFLFQKIHSLAGVNSFLDSLIVFLAEFLPYFLIGVLALAFLRPKLFGLKKRWPTVLALITAFAARFLVKEVVILFYNRPRPFDILEEVNLLVSHSSFESFPSGHAIFFFALAGFLIFYNRNFGVWLFLGAILISLARVSAGLHFPSDILAGGGLGILLGTTVFVLVEKFSKMMKIK